jgi:tetratricopeptide (TPR) repeat protein
MDLDTLRKMIADGKDSAMLRLTLARLLAQNQEWPEAIEHLESAVRLDPGYTAAWKELGRASLAAGRPDAALTAWQRGIEVAEAKGDKQAGKEMNVFLRRLQKSLGNQQG